MERRPCQQHEHELFDRARAFLKVRLLRLERRPCEYHEQHVRRCSSLVTTERSDGLCLQQGWLGAVHAPRLRAGNAYSQRRVSSPSCRLPSGASRLSCVRTTYERQDGKRRRLCTFPRSDIVACLRDGVVLGGRLTLVAPAQVAPTLRNPARPRSADRLKASTKACVLGARGVRATESVAMTF